MSAHTPGPWICLPTGFGIEVAPETEICAPVATVLDDPKQGRAVANAALIAAAPDLLEALKELVAELDSMACNEEEPSTVTRARAAIAKATKP